MGKDITEMLESQGIKVKNGKIAKADEQKALEAIKSFIASENNGSKLADFINKQCDILHNKIKELVRKEGLPPRSELSGKLRIHFERGQPNLMNIYYPQASHVSHRSELFPGDSLDRITSSIKKFNDKIYPMAGDCQHAIEEYMHKNKYKPIEDSDVGENSIFMVSDSFIDLKGLKY